MTAASSSWVTLVPGLQLSAVLADTGLAGSVPPPSKQPPAGQGGVPCSSEITAAQVDVREEIPYRYSLVDGVVLLNRSSDDSSEVPKVCSGSPAMQLRERQVCQ